MSSDVLLGLILVQSAVHVSEGRQSMSDILTIALSRKKLLRDDFELFHETRDHRADALREIFQYDAV